MSSIVLITGASSGFGRMTALALARAGAVVYASMRSISGKNRANAEELSRYAVENGVDLRPLELDVTDEASIDAAFKRIESDSGRLDVLIHNAGHMCFGPTEAFTPEQLQHMYDVNVVGTQRVNRIVLPHFRKRRQGVLVWVGSTSSRGGVPPYLAPYFAAKAGMDALAVSYAGELARWGIESTIVVPGAFTKGTNHFSHAAVPDDTACEAEYASGPTRDIAEVAGKGLASLEPPDSDPQAVADAIVNVVNLPRGKRPFRVHIDPVSDGAEIVNGVADRVRAELLRNIGLGDLLTVRMT